MKLKALKVALKQWRRSSFDNPYAKIKDIRGKLPFTRNLVLILLMLSYKEMSLLCKTNWGNGKIMKRANENKKTGNHGCCWVIKTLFIYFFNSAVKSRQARNHITHLITEEGEAVFNTSSIEELAPAYYEKLFNQSSYWNVFPEVIVKKKLTSRASQWLRRNVTN